MHSCVAPSQLNAPLAPFFVSAVPRSVDWLEAGPLDANFTFRDWSLPRIENGGRFCDAGRARLEAFFRVFSLTSRYANCST